MSQGARTSRSRRGPTARLEGSDIPIPDSSDAERLLLLSSDWLWESDEHHRISWLSVDFAERMSLSPSAVLGRLRLPALIDPQILLPAEAGAPLPFRNAFCRFRGGDGHGRHAVLCGVPRFDAHRRFLGYRGTGRLSVEQVAAAEITLSPLDLAADLPVPVFVKTPDLRFSMVNLACGSMFNRHPDRLVGIRVGDVLPPRLAYRVESAEQAVLLTGVPCHLTLPLFGEARHLHLSRLNLRRNQAVIVGCFHEPPDSDGEAASPAEALKGRRVLVVHRDPDVRRVLSQQFVRWHLDACAAGNATEALAVLRAAALSGSPAECILLDERMPHDQLSSIIRVSPRVARAPLVLMGDDQQVDQVLSTLATVLPAGSSPMHVGQGGLTPH